MEQMIICVSLLVLVTPLLAQSQYQPYPGQQFPSGQFFSGQPATPDYTQPLVATNYKADGHQRSESVDGQGNVKGEYSYVDPNGKTITVKYTAGKDGYQVEGDHLPRPPTAAPVQPQPQYQPQQYQSQYQPQQYQSQYQPQQYQPQYQPQQYQSQYQPQQYQSQYQPQQYQSQYQPQQFQPDSQYQSQPSFQFKGFPENRFGSPSIPPGVTVNQTPNGGFTYSYSPVPQHQ